MKTSPPRHIVINHDDDCASHVGQTSNGFQFFLTTPFVPSTSTTLLGSEFIALYLFDQEGRFVQAYIDKLGPREYLNSDQAAKAFDHRLSQLGEVEYCTIMVQPFQIEQFGITFGLILHEPRGDNDEWFATVEPGNYMAFHEPWDSDVYDT